MFQVLKYIIKNNNFIDIPKYILSGMIFQIFKRVAGGVVSRKIFNGKNILMYPRCNVSSMYAYTDIPDKQEIILLRNEVQKVNDTVVFFDIGANVGSYSVCMMDICEEIVAFEPHPFTAKRCKMNFLLNNFSENSVYQLALSDRTGKIFFSDFGESSTINHIIDNEDGIEVSVTTLDDFIFENKYSNDKKYILKVDVEGFEKQLFAGAEKFLKGYNILGIMFESYSVETVFDLLRDYGYGNIIKINADNYYAKKNRMD